MVIHIDIVEIYLSILSVLSVLLSVLSVLICSESVFASLNLTHLLLSEPLSRFDTPFPAPTRCFLPGP